MAAKKKRKTTRSSKKKAGATRGATRGLAAAGTTTVERKSVGSAVQAAVSLEGATVVTATATDGSAARFQVDWN